MHRANGSRPVFSGDDRPSAALSLNEGGLTCACDKPSFGEVPMQTQLLQNLAYPRRPAHPTFIALGTPHIGRPAS